MTPNQKHNLKWAVPILLVRAPLMLPIIAIGWLYEVWLEPFADWLTFKIPGFKR